MQNLNVFIIDAMIYNEWVLYENKWFETVNVNQIQIINAIINWNFLLNIKYLYLEENLTEKNCILSNINICFLLLCAKRKNIC